MMAIKDKTPPKLRRTVGTRRTVLLVDDEQLLLDTIALLLEPDYDVVTTTDSEHAWELVRDGARFDAIVSDLCMPAPDGRELYERILRLDPLQASRFVIVTGGASNGEGQAFLESMAGRVLLKPFGSNELCQLVAHTARLNEPVNDTEEAGYTHLVRRQARSSR